MTAVVLNTAGMFQQTSQVQQTTGGKDGQTSDFEGLMLGKIGNSAQQGMTKVSDNAVNSADTSKKVNTRQSVSSDDAKKDVKKEAAVQTSDDGKISENVSDADNKIQQQGGMTGETEEENINRDEVAAVLNVLGTIIQGITEILDITPEELQTAMESLSMQPADLTDRNCLAQLVLALNNTTDISDMLVDNGMFEQFNELAGFVEETLAENGFETEGFINLVESAEFADKADELIGDDNFKNELPEIITKFIRNQSEEKVADAPQEEDNIELPVEEGPEVTVVKQENQDTDAKSEDDGMAKDASSEIRTTKTSEKTETVKVSAEQFVQNLEKAADEVSGINGQTVDVRDVVYQVVQQIRVNISPENTSLEMRLNPENLGRVAINITSKNGVMTAEIHTENQTAREAIESQLQILKENIQERGLKVEAIEVRVSDFNFNDSRNSESDAYSESQNGSRKNRKFGFDSSEGTEEVTDAVKAAREYLENAGSTVSYRV